MDLFENTDHLKKLADKLHESTYDPFFASRYDLEEKARKDSEYTELSETDKDKVFDYYSNHDEYAEQEAEALARKKEKEEGWLRSLDEQQARIREQEERERSWEKEADERVSYVSARLSQVHKYENRFLEFCNFKYTIVGVKNGAIENNLADMFDRVVGTPAFARFIKYKTGEDFVPMSYVPGERFDYDRLYPQKNIYDIPKQWKELFNLDRYNPELANPEERKEYFKKYAGYLEDGSFNRYLENVDKIKYLQGHMDTWDALVSTATSGKENFQKLFEIKATEVRNKVARSFLGLRGVWNPIDGRDYAYKLFSILVVLYIYGMMVTDNYVLCTVGAVIGGMLAYIIYPCLIRNSDQKFNLKMSETPLETLGEGTLISKDPPKIYLYYNPMHTFDYAFTDRCSEELEADFQSQLEQLHQSVEKYTHIYLNSLVSEYHSYERQFDRRNKVRIRHMRGYYFAIIFASLGYALILYLFC